MGNHQSNYRFHELIISNGKYFSEDLVGPEMRIPSNCREVESKYSREKKVEFLCKQELFEIHNNYFLPMPL